MAERVGVRLVPAPPVRTRFGLPLHRPEVSPGLMAELPPAGAAIDGVALPSSIAVRSPGLTLQVQAGAAFAADAELEVDGGGRFVTRAAGVLVARSLESAAAAGAFAWARLE